MEDILASIRRIITEDQAPPPARPEPSFAPEPEVLELVDAAQEPERARATPPSSGATAADITLEALVRSALAPILRDWLDANLPGIVEAAVRAEVTRITRKD